ncbi:MAG: cytochrome C biogenesis protein ResB [Desulfuromonadales bacterium]|nr:cytochrome C biogenesis protein ResB [Desulfuromonadales bacterium]
MLKNIWRFCVSIELCLGLLLCICVAMAVGSFSLKGDYAAAINAVPLLIWLREVPVGTSWWLWLTVVLLALLVLNTILCSVETLRFRWRRAGMMSLFAPQLIHAGFLLIVLAHLQSASGGYMQQLEVVEGMLARLPDGRPFGVAGLDVVMSPMGMPIRFSGELATNPSNPAERVTISPNHPWFSGGYGVYIKQAEGYPSKRALLEIHREPGAGMALAGVLIFTLGNILLVYLRSRSKENGCMDVEGEQAAGQDFR